MTPSKIQVSRRYGEGNMQTLTKYSSFGRKEMKWIKRLVGIVLGPFASIFFMFLFLFMWSVDSLTKILNRR